MTGKVVHFEIPIDDGDRAVAFYREAFGWSLERWGPWNIGRRRPATVRASAVR